LKTSHVYFFQTLERDKLTPLHFQAQIFSSTVQRGTKRRMLMIAIFKIPRKFQTTEFLHQIHKIQLIMIFNQK
jgi:hypothetical protein